MTDIVERLQRYIHDDDEIGVEMVHGKSAAAYWDICGAKVEIETLRAANYAQTEVSRSLQAEIETLRADLALDRREIDKLRRIIERQHTEIETLRAALRQELDFHHKFSPPCFTDELSMWKTPTPIAVGDLVISDEMRGEEGVVTEIQGRFADVRFGDDQIVCGLSSLTRRSFT